MFESKIKNLFLGIITIPMLFLSCSNTHVADTTITTPSPSQNTQSGFFAEGSTSQDANLPPGYEVEDSQWPFSNSIAVTVNFDMLPMKIEAIAVSNITYGSTENGAKVFTGSLETYDDQHPLNTCKDPWSSWESPASVYNKIWIESQNPARIVVKMRTAMVWEGPGGFDPELGGTNCPEFDAITRAKPIAREYENAVTPWGAKGEWAEETYYIYPDGVHTRYAQMFTNHAATTQPFGADRMAPNYVHDFGDMQVWFDANQSATPKALGVMDKHALTLMKMDGTSQDFSYHKPYINEGVQNDNFGAFADANIAIVNFKNTTYKPFLIGRTRQAEFFVPDESLANKADKFENHDLLEYTDTKGKVSGGMWAPIGFLLNKDYYERHTTGPNPFVSEVYLRGMVRSANAKEETHALAKSWLNPPQLQIMDQYLSGGQYDQKSRAYHIKKENQDQLSVSFSLEASNDAPAGKPSVVIQGWGHQLPSQVLIDGKAAQNGRDFRYGLEGSSLVIWFNLHATQPTQITVNP